MKIKLLEKVLAMSELDLEFSGISVQRTTNNELIAVLQLSSPIELVRGSQEVEFQGQKIPVTAKDVTEVKVHQNDFDGIEWDDESNTGSYKGSVLSLDVAKNGRQVWMVSRSFAQAGQEFRQNRRNDRLTELVKGLGVEVKEEKKEKPLVPVE